MFAAAMFALSLPSFHNSYNLFLSLSLSLSLSLFLPLTAFIRVLFLFRNVFFHPIAILIFVLSFTCVLIIFSFRLRFAPLPRCESKDFIY